MTGATSLYSCDARGVAPECMANDPPENEIHRDALLEVHGFELLAQVEEMLRHVREYQRQVQRLRDALSGQTTTAPRTPTSAVREQLRRLRNTWTEVEGTLNDIERIIAPN
jgi:hypothetical protein